MAIKSNWQLVCATVRGKSHIDGGIPNQDAFQVSVSTRNSNIVAAVVSDGAGTAPRAQEGSEHFSKAIARGLVELAEKVDDGRVPASSASRITDSVYREVENARAELDLPGNTLSDFHCTLVAVVISPKLRLMLKIGDSLMTKSRFQPAAGGTVDYFADMAMTQQERSEFANETHFITQANWRSHLVCDTLPENGDETMFTLMTDGAADIALSGDSPAGNKQVFRPFFANLVANLLTAEPSKRDAVLESALADSGTYRLTGDDKTMVVLLRSDAFEFAAMEPLLSAPAATTVAGPAVHSSPTAVVNATPKQNDAILASAAEAVSDASPTFSRPKLSTASTDAGDPRTGSPASANVPLVRVSSSILPKAVWFALAIIVSLLALSGLYAALRSHRSAGDTYSGTRDKAQSRSPVVMDKESTQAAVAPGTKDGAVVVGPNPQLPAVSTSQGARHGVDVQTADRASEPTGQIAVSRQTVSSTDTGSVASAPVPRPVITIAPGKSMPHNFEWTRTGEIGATKRRLFEGGVTAFGKCTSLDGMRADCKFGFEASPDAHSGRWTIALKEVAPTGLSDFGSYSVDVVVSTPSNRKPSSNTKEK